MQNKFTKEIKSLDAIFEFIADFTNDNHIPSAVKFAATLAIEEIFTNMVKYNAVSENKISLQMQVVNGELIINMTDYDVESFDVSQEQEVITKQPIEMRTPGGLGLHLVKQMMDSVDYRYENRVSKITLIKKLET